jgi:predicted lipoprotein
MSLLAGLLLVGACASGPGEAEVVSNATDQALIPAMTGAAEAAGALSTAAFGFCASPHPKAHEAAMDAWNRAKEAWEASELTTFFGPAEMLRTVSKVDYNPISQDEIDALLGSDAVIDAAYVGDRASSVQRGLGAVEYVLFRDEAEAGEARTCELTTAAAEVIADATRALQEAWVESFDGGEPWADTFTVTIPSNQALGDLVSAFVETTKRQSLFELGKALGISAPQPEIEAIPEGAAGAAAAMYRSQLVGIRDALAGGNPDSLGGLIRARSAEVADTIDLLLEQSIEAIAALDRPMRDIARDDPERLVPIYEDIAELRMIFEADVVSLLDITLGFSDTDGDTG